MVWYVGEKTIEGAGAGGDPKPNRALISSHEKYARAATIALLDMHMTKTISKTTGIEEDFFLI